METTYTKAADGTVTITTTFNGRPVVVANERYTSRRAE